MATKMGRFELRIDDELLTRVDEWAAEQDGQPPRAEAVRRLIEQGLAASSKRTVRFSDGEKVLMLMMRDIHKHLDVKNGESDPDFMADVIYGGHYWAPKWEMQGLFNDHIDDPRELKHVVDVLDMWSFIEEAYEKLSSDQKEQIEREASPFGKHVRFAGFDGNNETSQMSIALFLVEKMGRFTRFQGREFNSHYPTYASYRRMVAVFEAIRPSLVGHGLSVNQIIEILQARRHAE
jgi:uncharacterized protein